MNGGGAGRSLENYLRFKSPDLDIHMVVPEFGVMGKFFSKNSRLWVVPEFVERIHQSRHRIPKFLDFPWVHILVNSFELFVAAKKIKKIADEIKPDIIYCNHMLANPVGAYVGWKTKISTVYHARNIHEAWMGRLFYSWLAKLSFVKKIICNSYASAELFMKVVPEKVEIVYNFVDLHLYDPNTVERKLRKEFKIADLAFIFGYSGRLLPKKGVPILLHAFKQIVKDYPESRLVILGDNDGGVHVDWKQKFKDMVLEWGIPEKVIFTGFQEQVQSYLAEFDVLVLPSVEYESFGRVLIEAMSMRIPCIATKLGGSTEVIQDGTTGYLVEPSNIEDLRRKMKLLISQKDLRKKFGDAGYDRVHKTFSGEILSKKISEILISI